jgi:hypothetical protein
MGDHHGHDHIVDEFTTICAISAYHHNDCEFESSSGEVYQYSIQHYMIKFVSDLRQVSGFLRISGIIFIRITSSAIQSFNGDPVRSKQ